MATRRRRRFIDPNIGDHLLREAGEVVIVEVPHHWVVYVVPVAELLAAFGFLLLCLLGPVESSLFFLVVAVALAVHGCYRVLTYHKDRFVVTDMRVFRVSGVFSETVATMPMRRILDITMSKPLPGRVLRYGHFTFESAAQEQGLKRIRFVGTPDALDKKIQETVQKTGLRGQRAK